MAAYGAPARERSFRIPGWLAFVIFVPLQVWLFWKLLGAWGFWWNLLFFLTLGFLGNRAARAAWFTQMLFPNRAHRHEMRRHVFQGILFLAAALTWLAPQASFAPAWVHAIPQPWVPIAFVVTLLKAALR